MKAPGPLDVAVHAARAVDPLAVLLLFGVHLLFGAALWMAAAWTVGDVLTNRPPPDLFGWIAVGLSHPEAMRRLLLASAVIGAVYLLGGAFLGGALLARLERWPRALRTGLRHLGRLLLLRVVALSLLGAVIAGAVTALPWVFERSLELADERLQASLLLVAALPVLLAALACALLLHYGQPLLVRDHPLRDLPGETLALIHRRPLATAGLYLVGWAAWGAVTLLGLPGIFAALLRVVIHVWSYAAAAGATQAWVGAGSELRRLRAPRARDRQEAA